MNAENILRQITDSRGLLLFIWAVAFIEFYLSARIENWSLRTIKEIYFSWSIQTYVSEFTTRYTGPMAARGELNLRIAFACFSVSRFSSPPLRYLPVRLCFAAVALTACSFEHRLTSHTVINNYMCYATLHHEMDYIRKEPREEDIVDSFNQKEARAKWITRFQCNHQFMQNSKFRFVQLMVSEKRIRFRFRQAGRQAIELPTLFEGFN